jgi:hypothetical protein
MFLKNIILKRIGKVLLIWLLLVGGLLLVSPVLAQQSPDVGLEPIENNTNLPTADVRVVILRIVQIALGLLGTIALVLIIYGGYTWMTAAGNEEKVTQAKKIITNAAVGLAIIILSAAITQFIISAITKAATGTNYPDHCYNGKQDEDEADVDCGGSCGVCSGGGGGSLPGGTVFYVDSLPGSGDMCVRNVHLVVVFNKEVDLATMKGNVIVEKKDGGQAVAGNWQYGTEHNNAVFVPEGSCGTDAGSDCLEPSTLYRLVFKNPTEVKSTGKASLNCTVKAGCNPVEFKTGDGVDRKAPTITIVAPPDNSSIQAGNVVPVKVDFTDDNGVQNIALYAEGNLVTSQSLSSCKKSGTVDLSWPTTGLNAGSYLLQSVALDWSAGRGNANSRVTLLPFHCFNDVLEKDLGESQKGPPACGGECGSCGGDTCQSNTDCASGYCDLSGGRSGTCVDKMRIESVSPNSGAPGTYVTISGKYFTDQPGTVYFAKVKNPRLDNKADWVQAKLVNCGVAASNWNANQIIVEVPVGAVNGPLAVIADKFSDVTNDDWGPKIPDFNLTNQLRPGLCSVIPTSGSSGESVQLNGKNFGLFDNANDSVLFGTTKAVIKNSDWFDTAVKTTVPYLDYGVVGVKLVNNGVESNSVRFVLNQNIGPTDPVISSISPGSGAPGEYITITGKNFGSSVGAVWFKANANSEAILGDFTFPSGCERGTWRDDQIIVKFPKEKGEVGKQYAVQIKTASNKVTPLDTKLNFSLTAGSPAPGICSITPQSGPIPFPGGETIKLTGEYFDTDSAIYFWKNGASPTSVDGRSVVPKDNIISSNETAISLKPGTDVITGPVVVVRTTDKKMSNPAQFTVYDCVKNNNKCSASNQVCCVGAGDTGVCKPDTELCQGQTFSAGYVWRFSTADITLIPQVVERCDVQTEDGKALPTPTPNVAWDTTDSGDQHNVCRGALVTVEFNMPLDQNSVSSQTITVNKCASVNQNNCVNPTPVKLTSDSYRLAVASAEQDGNYRSFLQMYPEAGKWDDTSWYQVVLSKGVKSYPRGITLAEDKTCDVVNSAYCFVFKTDAKDCKLRKVVVTPYSYWTNFLEAPIKYRAAGVVKGDLNYLGNGLSDQRCIMMDMSAYTWNWNSSGANYADIMGDTTRRSVQASALANTVGVGLKDPENAVTINATASLSGNALTGISPLTIDLSNPDVVDYWPKCLEACTNGEVGIKFNMTMSTRNLPGSVNGGTVQLLKCHDENCFSTESVLSLGDVYLDPTVNYSILKLANSKDTSVSLEPNTVYQVIVSSSSTNPEVSATTLWSSSKLGDPTLFNKPYNKVLTWRFKTKKDKCVVDRASVVPQEFYASSIKEKTTYKVEAYSSPDSCYPQGQKINPWTVSWDWSSSDQKVATLQTFTTKGTNKFCTPFCVHKGSDLPAGNPPGPVCGNGVVEAGEDCDQPDKGKGCSLSCLFTGNTDQTTCGNGTVDTNLGESCDPKDPKTALGCSKICLRLGSQMSTGSSDLNASICGNGAIGSGEDCDVGIAATTTDSRSALRCSEKCVHLGTQLSSKWCYDNRLSFGGFSAPDYQKACTASFSQCGDKIQSPDEDPGCDDPAKGWNSAECTQFCLKKTDTECTSGKEGCNSTGHNLGSSLLYSKSSLCGDGVVGIGEDAFCETGLSTQHDGLIDPWALATGVGLGTPTGEPPTQVSNIQAITKQQTKSEPGKYLISCGYKNDDECKEVFGGDYGVGGNGCCFARSKLVSTYPVDNTANACPNTYLEAVFDNPIDQSSVQNNIIIARGAKECGDKEDVTALVQATFKDETLQNAPWYKRWLARISHFVQSLWGDTASALPPKWCAGNDVGDGEVVPVSETNSTTSKIAIKLDAPLAFDTEYAIILKEGLKNTRGVSIGKLKDNKNISWKFTTVSQICELKSLTVTPPQWSFSKSGATTTLQAKGTTNNGQFIQGIPNFYDWAYGWGPLANPIVQVASTSSSLNMITAQNTNGEMDVRATADITVNKYSDVKGIAATGKSHIVVFLCENPWPPKDLIINNRGPFTIFPFQDKIGNNDGFDIASNTFNNTPIPASTAAADGYFNFSTYYCADQGSTGTFDDLPYLRGAVQVANNIVSTSSSLKRFIFTNTKNSDAIGMQVFPNPRNLTAEEWYALSKEQGGQGFTGELQSLTIDNYPAVSDGNNIYVDALNYADSTKNLYSNIYLFSINSTAQKETRTVFDQLVKNLKFNINVTNYGYCGVDSNNPGFEKTCKNDLDCSNGQVCSQTVDKLKRNYQRLRDLRTLQDNLTNYAKEHNNTYPPLVEGTYLRGQVISTWPTWPVLGSTIGAAIPEDPINKLGKAGTCSKSMQIFCTEDTGCPRDEKCVIHDEKTAWSTEDRRFSFACATSSFAYRYVFQDDTNYIVKSHFENPGLTINNFNDLASRFIDQKRFIINDRNGICMQDQEVSTLNQGRCGDGQVNLNRGEECDPTGRVQYSVCSPDVNHKDQIKVDVCDQNCKWTPSSTPYVACSFLSNCGNGKVETGETCDDGKLNGRYNKCTTKCTWPPDPVVGYCGDGQVQKAYELCDIKDAMKSAGICTEGLLQGSPCNNDQDCNTGSGIVFYGGKCVLTDESKVRYGKTQETSCNWDCQSTGPYCGDGVVQGEFGEECETNQSCSLAGASNGTKVCTKDCKVSDTAAVAWWRFDSAAKNTKTNITVFPSDIGGLAATCQDKNCPEFSVDGKIHHSFNFDGVDDAVEVTHSSQFSPTTSLSVEAWINPSGYNDWMRVVEKGGYLKDGGYGLQFDNAHHQGFVVWDKNSAHSFGVSTINEVPLNQWTHVVGVYQRKGSAHTAKIYVNGKLDNSYATDTPQIVMQPSLEKLMIGQSVSGGANFKGRIDEVKVYNRALTDAEIENRYKENWVCSVKANTSGENLASCGDGRVDEGEACDKASQNGISCVPGYGRSCTYCAYDCKNIIDVQPREFCGNGIIEGPEACDVDRDTGVMYAADRNEGTDFTTNTVRNGFQILTCSEEQQATSTFKKGTKACSNKCLAIQNNCVACGALPDGDKRGVEVRGSIINILDPLSANPLLGGPGQDGTIDVTLSDKFYERQVGHIYWAASSAATYYLKSAAEDGYDVNTPVAKINSDSKCSFSEEPNYKMFFNADNGHVFDFDVLAAPQSWQYDLLLSPVISQTVRPQDIRVVTTWVGADPDFFPGFIIPSLGAAAAIEGPTFGSTSVGTNYYTQADLQGMWYHGFGFSPGKSNVQAFTIDTTKLIDDQYLFYVRVPQARPGFDPGISRYKDSTKLKVDIYLPESDTSNRHFALPSMTFYLNSALPSQNPAAPYWYLFNLKKDGATLKDKIVPVNRIITEWKNIVR